MSGANKDCNDGSLTTSYGRIMFELGYIRATVTQILGLVSARSMAPATTGISVLSYLKTALSILLVVTRAVQALGLWPYILAGLMSAGGALVAWWRGLSLGSWLG